MFSLILTEVTTRSAQEVQPDLSQSQSLHEGKLKYIWNIMEATNPYIWYTNV